MDEERLKNIEDRVAFLEDKHQSLRGLIPGTGDILADLKDRLAKLEISFNQEVEQIGKILGVLSEYFGYAPKGSVSVYAGNAWKDFVEARINKLEDKAKPTS
jgi:hypothetical protein